jgi:hypothetical protein
MFMKNVKVLGGVAAALVTLALCVPAVAADNVTVGDFVLQLAKAKSLTANDPMQAQSALAANGVQVPAIDLGKTLTQGDVVAIGNAAGLNLNSSTPSAEFGSDQLSAFMISFGPELGTSDPENATDGDKPKTDPLTKGKGKKKGLLRSASEPL